MNQDEATLIYNYLHDNYEYRDDGNLVRTKDSPRNGKSKKGDVLGSFFYQSEQAPRIRCTLYINKFDYTKNLSHLIYLFHHKEVPDVIEYIDENPMNCCIENLKPGCRVEIQYKKGQRGYFPYKTKAGITRYRITLQIGKDIKVCFGSSDTEEEARAIYEMAKEIYVYERLEPIEIKKRIMAAFPHRSMKLAVVNKWGYPGIYQRGARFVARFDGQSSTHDTPEEAYKSYLDMKEGKFTRTNRLKLSDTCTVDGCGDPYYTKNMCSKHYAKHIRQGKRRIRANKTGYAGVKEDKGKFSARYKDKHIGSFKTAQEAHEAYLATKKKDLTNL
jgi:hypothetical protein